MVTEQLRPNLFIPGFQKCGSSSLFDFLAAHDQVAGTVPKETFAMTDNDYEHFDISKSVTNPGFSWDPFLQGADNAKYILEGSVCNFYQDTALDYAASIDGAKAIFILRDPVDRFISVYNYFGGSGVHLKPGTTPEQFFDLTRKKGFKKEALNFALEHGKYSEYINRWKEKLGAENIHIVGMKQMINDPDAFSAGVFNFLGLAPVKAVTAAHSNKTKRVKHQALNRFLVKNLGGMGLKNTVLMKLYKKLLHGDSVKVKVSDNLTATLREYYKEEYTQYSEYF